MRCVKGAVRGKSHLGLPFHGCRGSDWRVLTGMDTLYDHLYLVMQVDSLVRGQA